LFLRGISNTFSPPSRPLTAQVSTGTVLNDLNLQLNRGCKASVIDDAVRRANDTRYGLAGSVWSADTARATAIAARLEVGTAWVNQHRHTMATVPFGGAKESGMGRNYSLLGLRGNMEPRVVSILKG
jgi:acyl-CoA reductase-like NAD-dependent aldehyde dehydrogenase